jgi:predicted alpha/beta hydrolase
VARSLLVAVGALLISCVLAATAAASPASQFGATVDSLLGLPYQPDYVPLGTDSAFGSQAVLNTAPAEDYTSGSIPGSPDAPAWPAAFHQVVIHTGDGAPLIGEVALQPGRHPGVLVVHGFNTHGTASVVRWAAMLAANGYNVAAFDQRDFSFEYSAGYGSPDWLQTFGWKESQDVLAAGRYLSAQAGVRSLGIVGFSEGAQNTILALSLDAQSSHPIFAAGLTFSAPADQDTQIYSTAVPQGCASPACAYPATDALAALVVPPYDNPDVCSLLGQAATYYGTSAFAILSHEAAFHAQTNVRVPLLNFYSADDSLVPAFEASMTAAYELGLPLERTVLIARGEHAYFFDRWWQQAAILRYFKQELPDAARDAFVSTAPTVNQTSGGASAASQTVAFGPVSPAWADAQLAPYVCDTTQGAPGA